MFALASHVKSNVCAIQHYHLVSSVGKLLSVQIAVLTEPAQYSTYAHAIKVTVDGPREPRSEFCFCLTVTCLAMLCGCNCTVQYCTCKKVNIKNLDAQKVEQ